MDEVMIYTQPRSLIVKEYNGQRVITLKDVDELHQRPDGTARRNFNENKNRFIEGGDYFVRNSYEAKTEFGITAPNGLIVLTMFGYLMLVKSLNDDLAWHVQRQLVNNYFQNRQDAAGFRTTNIVDPNTPALTDPAACFIRAINEALQEKYFLYRKHSEKGVFLF